MARKVYKHVSSEDWVYHPKSITIKESFIREWLVLNANENSIFIPKQYASDGCSPKFNVLDLFTIGIPDGVIDHRTGKPKTYNASRCHDAICQYIDDVPLSNEEIVALFDELLGDFIPKSIYVSAVRHLGTKKVAHGNCTVG